MKLQTLLDELDAMLEEHDQFTAVSPPSSAHTALIYIDLIIRMARTFDTLLLVPVSDTERDTHGTHAASTHRRVVAVLGAAVLVADIQNALSRQVTRPATQSVERWFNQKRLERIRAAATGRNPTAEA